MALTINQQFNRFVEFASARNDVNSQNVIARVGDPAGGGMLSGRTIKEAEGDTVKKLFRADDLQRENDLARKLFRQSVVDIFGGMSKVPDSVKEAMKLKDYDQGKPLMVRRIMAVKAAIDVYAERAIDALARAKAAAEAIEFYGAANEPAAAEKRARIDRLLTVAVNAAVSDPDVLELVIACGRPVVEVTGDRTLRTEDEIKDRVARLVANVAELRAVAKGDQRILRAGLAFLKAMQGKPLPDGMIRTLVQTTMKQSISVLKALKANSSGFDLHGAAVQIFGNTTKAVTAADGLSVTKTDGDVKNRFRTFCLQLMLGRLGDSSLPGIKTLLEAKGPVLVSFYGDIAGNLKFGEVSPAIREYMKLPARNFLEIIDILYTELQVRQGMQQGEVKLLPGKRNPNYAHPEREDYVDIDAADVAEDIRDNHAETFVKQYRKKYLDNKVAGNGAGAAVVRKVFDNAMPNPVYTPDSIFNDRAENNVRGLVNLGISRMRMTSAAPLEAFKQNFISLAKFDVVMPDGSKLERNEGAIDRLDVLLAHLCEDCYKAAEKAGMLALDPDGRDDSKLNSDVPYTKRQFSLSFTGRNNKVLCIKCETERKFTKLYTKNHETGYYDSINAGEGSKIRAGYTVAMPVAELSRLAELSFKDYSDNEVQRKLDDPNVTNPYQSPRQLLGNDYAYSATVEISAGFEITVN